MKNMTWFHWVGVALVGIATAAPHFLPFIPAPYAPAAAAVVAALGSLLHLNMQAP